MPDGGRSLLLTGAFPLPAMDERPHSPPGREEEQKQCVRRYEAMVQDRQRLFFDVEEFALIIGYYLDKVEFSSARQALELGLEQHPTSIDLRYWEADVLIHTGRLNRALEVLDGLQKIEPFNAAVHLHKGSIYSQLRNYRRAVEHYRRALDLADEDHDNIYLDLAFEYENLEEFEQAIACLQQAVEINPENEAALYELAYAYDLAEANEAAVVFFRRFTNEHPYSFVGWYNLGNALFALDRPEESTEALDLALAIDERFTSAYFSKARNLVTLGKYPEAIENYQEALRVDGPQPVTFSFLGECYEKMEHLEQALIHYDQALALDHKWVDAWIGRGVVKDMQGRLPEAVKDLEEAVRCDPDNCDGWYYLANTLGRMGRYDEAIAAYTRVNTMEPESLDGWMDHADLMLHLKGPDAAVVKLREAEMVHQLNALYKYRMCSYLLRAGREQQAMQVLEEALLADHAAHTALLEHYPEAVHLPQVAHLLDLYRR